MANKCDGSIIVIASGKTHRDKAMEAKVLLEKAQSQLLGVVVNGVEFHKSEYCGEYS